MAIEVAIKKKIGNFCLDVAFSAGEEMFALLGASGCGKSMTLKCIAGIETPDEGKIILNGRTLFDSEKKINLIPQKRKVGYMFQDYALFPNMNVEKNIMAGMGRKPQKEIVQDYIRRFRLEGLEHHLPRQLSGGQKQRVALARMMASQPEILLLDEPLWKRNCRICFPRLGKLYFLCHTAVMRCIISVIASACWIRDILRLCRRRKSFLQIR